jgi:fused signal recognition particle receptor
MNDIMLINSSKRLLIMFDSLKKKIASWIGNSTKKIEESQSEQKDKSLSKKVEAKPKADVKKSSKAKEISKPERPKVSAVKIEKVVEPQVIEEETEPSVEKKSGFFSRIKSVFTSREITQDFFFESFNDLELILLESNVALSVVDTIKEKMASQLVGREFKRDEIPLKIKQALRDTIDSLFVDSPFNIISHIKSSNSCVKILFCGINGSGKTTTLAKFAHILKNNGISCVFAAGDTFRAASIEQLAIHGERLGVHVVKQTYGSDPAAVAYDAIQYAQAKKIKVVLIDTAGRMHTKQNLMDEMGKIVRVSKPDFKIFVGESITGNDATEQARIFNDTIGIDGIILTKADIDEKGGTAISVSKVTGRPILYLGMGQGYDDLVPFDKEKVFEALGL